jgi:dTDP-4-dehydrorhamnose reductase
MKIMVTGANGLLGQALIKQLVEKKYPVVATGKGPSRLIVAALEGYEYKELDITDGPAVEAFVLEEKPSVIIHAAAMTQVDQCEINKQDCYNVNVTATRFIIDAAKLIKARFIFVSTDFIFDGNSGPYKEEDKPAPVNYYGSTKLVAEKAVMDSGLHWAIARTILVYGVAPTTGRTNIVGWVKQSLENKMPIKMVTDQLRTPTFVYDLAAGIILMIEKNAGGIYHLSGDEKMTPYEMAIETAKFFGLDQGLISVSSSADIKQPAMRPPRTGFDISKAKKDLGYQPTSFKEGLKKIFL